MQKRTLIIGCGLSGTVLAERLASVKDEEVLIIDKREHIAGNVYDYEDKKTQISVHKYGPHVFHTSIKEVWEYLSKFTKWHYFMYRVKAFIDGKEVNIPFNLDSLHKVFPKYLANDLEQKLVRTFGFNKKVPILELKNTDDKDLQFLAEYIYQKVFLGYTMKQWGVKPEELDFSVSARVPVYVSLDDRYFQDTYQAIPLLGYTQMVQNMLTHQNIKLKLKTHFDFKDCKLNANSKYEYKDFGEFDRVIYTGAIDEFFNYTLGRLPYRSLDIVFERFDKEYVQSTAQINYPENYDFTRAVEYKYYLDEKSSKSILSYEFPCAYEEGKNERYYPIPDEKNQKLYEEYKKLTKELKNVHFLGRLADYKYYDMDKTIARALSVFAELN
ncbi:UDP-galactopyranose mutase [Campylobacter sp. MIT 12-5580]|uniref:UDP-galactopyranose mutase n=1 Tax=Campylobacter sp. MIT 12-5580 TaxID=2040651 RepID=UPI0010F91D3F|nr:UDP-galactopyranose mutase [Campylobacter sp. MIT 12-5580]TKX28195.1 UDP-galactopyranose mutase [Campylobacter sp. MIT 12-5580]